MAGREEYGSVLPALQGPGFIWAPTPGRTDPTSERRLQKADSVVV